MIDKYLENNNCFITAIDGNQCKSVKDFVVEIGRAFSFPDYYGENLDALNDCINDLDWILKDNYILIINNFELFISDNKQDRKDMIDFLDEISEQWRLGPQAEGQDKSRKKADFKVIYN
ncbi:barstar family protein [Aquimarina sp. W85]|uniref:barstar family protein n=1 Tax=Aquimarina rhodophyticola TaxID=3342246 RepID=UPI00366AB6F8